jgi:carbamoyltransferase
VLGNPRIKWQDNVSPYLGEIYSEGTVNAQIQEFKDQVTIHKTDDDDAINALIGQEIVAVFQGGSESGRRALGARSILADPRSPDMKDRVNERVKHRQWFRPFAPSILKEHVTDYFLGAIDSPYMGFVLKFREDKKAVVPAVVHFDGTARLQTVSKEVSPWYHKFLTMWNERSGVPILLNTSFNDREPICESARDAMRCFLGTDIDRLYFPDLGISVMKVKNDNTGDNSLQ